MLPVGQKHSYTPRRERALAHGNALRDGSQDASSAVQLQKILSYLINMNESINSDTTTKHVGAPVPGFEGVRPGACGPL